jgi:hypothetical protein
MVGPQPMRKKRNPLLPARSITRMLQAKLRRMRRILRATESHSKKKNKRRRKTPERNLHNNSLHF